MINLEGSTVIEGTAESLWEFISSLNALPQWTDVISVEQNGPGGIGTKAVATYRLLGKRTFTITITEWAPYRKLGMRFKLGAEFHEIISLEPVESDRTRLTISLQGEVKGLLRLGRALTSRNARKELSDRLAKIKRAFELREQATPN